MEKYDIEMETDSDALLRACVRKFSRHDRRLTLHTRWPRQPWTRYTTPDTLPFFTPEAIDLLEKLLRYDHHERLTAREAQAHAYFSKPLFHSAFFLSSHVPDLDVVRLEATGNPGDCVSDSGFYST